VVTVEVATEPPLLPAQTKPAGGIGEARGVGEIEGEGDSLGLRLGLGEESGLGGTVGVEPGLAEGFDPVADPQATSRAAAHTTAISRRIRAR
jgi:hypothetical protein